MSATDSTQLIQQQAAILQAMEERLAKQDTRIAELERHVSQLMEGNIIVVDGNGCGQFKTVEAAVAAATAGDTIVLRPGVYTETIRLHKEGITIQGADKEATILEPAGGAAAIIHATCRLQNVTINCKNKVFPALRLIDGSPIVENCSISSDNLSCVVVEGGTPRLVRSKVGPSKMYGIHWKSTARGGSIDSCTVSNCHEGNVAVSAGKNLQLISTVLTETPAECLKLEGDASATVEHCKMSECGHSAVQTETETSLTLHKCDIFHSSMCGVLIGGQATVTSCRIFDNQLPNVLLEGQARGVLQGNKILSGMQQGVVLRSGATATMAENVLQGNLLEGLVVEGGATVQ